MRWTRRELFLFCLLFWLNAFPLFAQNVIEDRSNGRTAPAVQITETQTLPLINASWPLHTTKVSADTEVRRIAAKLDRHVAEFLDGTPWMPFHHTLGISGYEVSFNHPDEMFYALSLALPFLSATNATAAKAFLSKQLAVLPPYSVDGFDNRTGRVRESYAVPFDLRVSGRGRARSAFGVYAFWIYVTAAGDDIAAQRHWPAIQARIQPLLDVECKFDITKQNDAHDEAETLNGDLAALIATVRLARTNTDFVTEQKARARARQLLELRINFERVNSHILETTDSSTKHLHISKLARFCDLTPEIGEALRTLTDGCGASHLKTFREARNGWYLAFGDRMIGGENYTNPLHFSRAPFAGAALVERLPSNQITSFIDVPWCQGDFYFIEKCALALATSR